MTSGTCVFVTCVRSGYLCVMSKTDNFSRKFNIHSSISSFLIFIIPKTIIAEFSLAIDEAPMVKITGHKVIKTKVKMDKSRSVPQKIELADS